MTDVYDANGKLRFKIDDHGHCLRKAWDCGGFDPFNEWDDEGRRLVKCVQELRGIDRSFIRHFRVGPWFGGDVVRRIASADGKDVWWEMVEERAPRPATARL